MAIYTTRQAAAALGVSERTIRKWIHSGELNAGKVARSWCISELEIERLRRIVSSAEGIETGKRERG